MSSWCRPGIGVIIQVGLAKSPILQMIVLNASVILVLKLGCASLLSFFADSAPLAMKWFWGDGAATISRMSVVG